MELAGRQRPARMPLASSGKEVLQPDRVRGRRSVGNEDRMREPTAVLVAVPHPNVDDGPPWSRSGPRRLKAGVGPGPTTEWGGRVNGEWLRRSPSTRFLDWVEKLLTTRPRDRPVATTSGAMVLEAASERAGSPEASFLGPPKNWFSSGLCGSSSHRRCPIGG